MTSPSNMEAESSAANATNSHMSEAPASRIVTSSWLAGLPTAPTGFGPSALKVYPCCWRNGATAGLESGTGGRLVLPPVGAGGLVDSSAERWCCARRRWVMLGSLEKARARVTRMRTSNDGLGESEAREVEPGMLAMLPSAPLADQTTAPDSGDQNHL